MPQNHESEPRFRRHESGLGILLDLPVTASQDSGLAAHRAAREKWPSHESPFRPELTGPGLGSSLRMSVPARALIPSRIEAALARRKRDSAGATAAYGPGPLATSGSEGRRPEGGELPGQPGPGPGHSESRARPRLALDRVTVPDASQNLFRSDGNSRFKCSTDLPTLVSESTRSHAPVVVGSGQRQQVMKSLGYAQ